MPRFAWLFRVLALAILCHAFYCFLPPTGRSRDYCISLLVFFWGGKKIWATMRTARSKRHLDNEHCNSPSYFCFLALRVWCRSHKQAPHNSFQAMKQHLMVLWINPSDLGTPYRCHCVLLRSVHRILTVWCHIYGTKQSGFQEARRRQMTRPGSDDVVSNERLEKTINPGKSLMNLFPKWWWNQKYFLIQVWKTDKSAIDEHETDRTAERERKSANVSDCARVTYHDSYDIVAGAVAKFFYSQSTLVTVLIQTRFLKRAKKERNIIWGRWLCGIRVLSSACSCSLARSFTPEFSLLFLLVLLMLTRIWVFSSAYSCSRFALLHPHFLSCSCLYFCW